MTTTRYIFNVPQSNNVLRQPVSIITPALQNEPQLIEPILQTRPLIPVVRQFAPISETPTIAEHEPSSTHYAFSDDKIDIRRVPTKWLWENPLEAKSFLDSLYGTFFQFNPIDDVLYHMYNNPHVKVPAVSEDANYRPTIRLAPDGKNFEVAHVDLRYPGLEAKTHVHEQTREEWLNRSTFFDAYLHLFDVDLYDAINNDSNWQIQKKVTFYLDLVSATLALAPAFTLSAALFGSEGSLQGVLNGAATDGFLSTFFLWAGLTALTHNGSFRDHPLGLAVRSALSWVALVRKFAENELFVAFKDYLGHDPKNYFHARHLRLSGLASKYLKVLFPNGIPIPNFGNVELELWKDIPNTFKWYNRVKELLSSTATKAKTPSEYVKTLVNQVKPTLTWAPQTSAILGRILLHYVANAAVIGGLGTASGMEANLGELALVTGMVTALGTAIHVYIDKEKQNSPALAMTYRRINSFVLNSPALLGITLAANDILPYPTALAASLALIVTAGAIIKAKEKEVIRFFPQK